MKDGSFHFKYLQISESCGEDYVEKLRIFKKYIMKIKPVIKYIN